MAGAIGRTNKCEGIEMLFLYGLFSWIIVFSVGYIAWLVSAIHFHSSFGLGGFATGAAAGIYFVIFANRKTFRDARSHARTSLRKC